MMKPIFTSIFDLKKSVFLLLGIFYSICTYSQTITKEELIGHWNTIGINYKIPKGIKKDELQQLMQLKAGFNNSSFEFRADGTYDFTFPLGDEMKIKNAKWSLIKGNKIIITENTPNSNHEIRETGALMIIYVKKIGDKIFFEIVETPFKLQVVKK